MLTKVISGGQTGIDQIGLKAAKLAGLKTGGTAPKRWRTENGAKPELYKLYGVVEHDSWRYEPRTRCNVRHSHGTVLFGDMTSAGSLTTIELCKDESRPHIENPSFEELVEFIEKNGINILNVAGNRGSKISDSLRREVGLKLLKVFTYFQKYNKSVPD